jgi:hypothetical protein
VLETIERFNPERPPLIVKPVPLAGFTRSTADAVAR